MFSNPPEIGTVYENVEKYSTFSDMPQMTVWRMRFVCCVTKAANTEYVILTAFLLQQWLHERSSLLRCTYIVVLYLRVMETF
jgi:hypothetical protein